MKSLLSVRRRKPASTQSTAAAASDPSRGPQRVAIYFIGDADIEPLCEVAIVDGQAKVVRADAPRSAVVGELSRSLGQLRGQEEAGRFLQDLLASYKRASRYCAIDPDVDQESFEQWRTEYAAFTRSGKPGLFPLNPPQRTTGNG
jgi:hypothetical protein